MALPAVSGGVKLRVVGTQGPAEFGMLFHFQRDVVTDATDLECNAWAVHVASDWTTDMVPILTNEQILTTLTVEGLNSSSDGVGAWAGSNPGSITASHMGAQVCVLQKDTIARRYRGGHPRHYWPSPQLSAMATTTTLTTGAVSYWTTAVGNWLADITAHGATDFGTAFTYVNVSYYSGHAIRSTPLTDRIVGSSIENMVATQRRRVGR